MILCCALFGNALAATLSIYSSILNSFNDLNNNLLGRKVHILSQRNGKSQLTTIQERELDLIMKCRRKQFIIPSRKTLLLTWNFSRKFFAYFFQINFWYLLLKVIMLAFLLLDQSKTRLVCLWRVGVKIVTYRHSKNRPFWSCFDPH